MFKGRTGTTYDGLDRVVGTKQGTTAASWQTSTRVQNTYDRLGRKLRTEDPDSETWHYAYDFGGAQDRLRNGAKRAPPYQGTSG